MNHYQYLIVGGGLAADAAARGIRELDAQGSIGLFSTESDPPYKRPDLSKGLWSGKSEEQIFLQTKNFVEALHLGRSIESLDVTAKQVGDDQGERYSYDKLLLATGSLPRHLPHTSQRTIYFRSLKDYHRLRALSAHAERVLVIGGGFIGAEMAAALQMDGKHVTLLFPQKSLGEHIYPPDLSLFLNRYYREKGVTIIPEEGVQRLEDTFDHVIVTTSKGIKILVDVVIVGIGVEPNVELAQRAGLKISNGIEVNQFLQTSNADVYAAGDVAAYPALPSGQLSRYEHEDNAVAMGRVAGRNMAGAGEAYTHLPFFYSDLFDLGYEAVGTVDSRLQIVADWREPFKKGVIYYLKHSRLEGVLLWNVWDSVDKARELLLQGNSYRGAELLGKI